MIQSRKGVKREENVTFGNFGITEEFNDTLLDMQWMTLRGPATDLYSLTETPGYLTLKCADKSAKEMTTSAFVCRRMQHHEFEAATTMYFNPEAADEKAGLLLFKDETHQYFMAVGQSESGRQIELIQVGREDKVLATQTLPSDAVCFDLKVVSEGTTYDFLYSLDGGKKWTVLADKVDAYYLSTANAGGFTGSTIALYATKK